MTIEIVNIVIHAIIKYLEIFNKGTNVNTYQFHVDDTSVKALSAIYLFVPDRFIINNQIPDITLKIATDENIFTFSLD